jgi:hypothetical protein
MSTRIENKGPIIPLGEMSRDGSAALDFLVEGIQNNWIKESIRLKPLASAQAKVQIRRDVDELYETIHTMHQKHSYNDILFLVQPMISKMREAQEKRMKEFEKADQAQARENQKADSIFSKLAELHLPPFDVIY